MAQHSHLHNTACVLNLDCGSEW